MKDGLLHSKRPSFMFQKATFQPAKGGLLQTPNNQHFTQPPASALPANRHTFANRGGDYCRKAVNKKMFYLGNYSILK